MLEKRAYNVSENLYVNRVVCVTTLQIMLFNVHVNQETNVEYNLYRAAIF